MIHYTHIKRMLNGLLNYSMRKLPVNLLQKLLTTIHKIIQKVDSIDENNMKRLIMLMNIVPISCYQALSICIQDTFRFDAFNDLANYLWENTIGKFDEFIDLFTYWKQSLPSSYKEMILALAKSSQSNINALNLLIYYCNEFYSKISEIVKEFLPIGNSNIEKLSELYSIFLDCPNLTDFLLSFPEFYYVSYYILSTNKISELVEIFKSNEVRSDLILESNLCNQIVNLLQNAKTTKFLSYLMDIEYSFLTINDFTDLRRSIPILTKCLRSENLKISFSGFLCLSLLFKYKEDDIDIELLSFYSSSFITYESRISKNCSLFVLSKCITKIHNHNSLVNNLCENLKTKDSSVIEYAKLIIKFDQENDVLGNNQRLNLYEIVK